MAVHLTNPAWGVSWTPGAWGVSWGVWTNRRVAKGGGGGGTWYPTRHELEALRKHLDHATDREGRNRKKRREAEDRLTDTLRKAYERAMGVEPVVAAQVFAAVQPPSLPVPGPIAEPVRIDFAAVARLIEEMGRRYLEQAEEDDIEMLLLAMN